MSYTTIFSTANNQIIFNFNYRRYNDHTSGKKELRYSICGEN